MMNEPGTAAKSDDGIVLTCPHCKQNNRVPYARLAEAAVCGKCKKHVREPGEPLEVFDRNLEALITGARRPVLVDFWAAWCGPCRVLGPEVEKVARKMAGELIVAKLDTDQSPASAQKHGARSIPLLVLFSGGREIWRDVGARTADQLERQLRTVM